MAGRKKTKSETPEPATRFFDDEERELVESFENALERGDLRPTPREEYTRGAAEWQSVARASMGRETVSVSLPADDLERIKAAARERGVSFETLMSRVLHDFAQSR